MIKMVENSIRESGAFGYIISVLIIAFSTAFLSHTKWVDLHRRTNIETLTDQPVADQYDPACTLSMEIDGKTALYKKDGNICEPPYLGYIMDSQNGDGKG